MAWRSGDHTTAQQYYARSLAVSRSIGDDRAIATALNGLAIIADDRGDLVASKSLYEESLAIRRRIGDTLGIGGTLSNLGMLSAEQRDYAASRSFHAEALHIFRTLSHPTLMTLEATNLGHVEQHLGNVASAAVLYREALELCLQTANVEDVALACLGLAGIAGRQANPRRAARLFEAVDRLLSAIDYPLEQPDHFEYDYMLAATKPLLDEAEWQSAWTEGYAMSLEQAITYGIEDEDGNAIKEMSVVEEAIDVSFGGVARVASATDTPAPTRYPAGLTKREVQVLCLLSQGLTYKEIAYRLVISSRTVDTHLINIYNKLGVKSRSATMVYSIEQKLCE
jgi:non-specific serine/threonine protein kinase